jgi:transposase
MNITTLGIDIAKEVFYLYGVTHDGQVVIDKKVSRKKLYMEVAKLPICRIGMESCGGSSYWARRFLALGHEVKLMNPKFVKPYVKSDKNDRNDSEGICEAVSRPSMRFAGVKNVEQQDIQSLHRIRKGIVDSRLRLTNRIRGILLEYGITVRQGNAGLEKKLRDVLSSDDLELSEVSILLKDLLRDEYNLYLKYEELIKKYDKQLEGLSTKDARCRKLLKIDGVGPKTATALVAMIGSGTQFKSGRQLAAYLGLVPRQYSSGNKELLLGITKRGDSYIRGLLIHGARSLLRHAEKKDNYRMRWFIKKVRERGQNKAVVALANRQARIIWKVLTGNNDFDIYYEDMRK